MTIVSWGSSDMLIACGSDLADLTHILAVIIAWPVPSTETDIPSLMRCLIASNKREEVIHYGSKVQIPRKQKIANSQTFLGMLLAKFINV